jgi:hypothetical protein
MPLYPDIISTVGRTPLIKLNRVAAAVRIPAATITRRTLVFSAFQKRSTTAIWAPTGTSRSERAEENARHEM